MVPELRGHQHRTGPGVRGCSLPPEPRAQLQMCSRHIPPPAPGWAEHCTALTLCQEPLGTAGGFLISCDSQVMVQKPRKRQASQAGPWIKQTQVRCFWLRQKPEQTRRHLRCYVASVPQGGQFFKPKAPLTVESNSSHSFPSIKGN